MADNKTWQMARSLSKQALLKLKNAVSWNILALVVFLKYLLVCHHFIQNSSSWGIFITFFITVSHHFDNCAFPNYYQGYVGNLWKFLINEFFQTVPPGKKSKESNNKILISFLFTMGLKLAAKKFLAVISTFFFCKKNAEKFFCPILVGA